MTIRAASTSDWGIGLISLPRPLNRLWKFLKGLSIFHEREVHKLSISESKSALTPAVFTL